MRTTKKYNNLNFTKRVDHDIGQSDEKRMTEPAICEKCEAIYTKGRWTMDKDVLKTDGLRDATFEERVCPACAQIETGIAKGFVYITGKFFAEHKNEIENLLRNEEEKIAYTNPLARIMKWKRPKDGLTLETTTEGLAQHLGRAMFRAYSGDVRYDFSHENKLARVYWERDD